VEVSLVSNRLLKVVVYTPFVTVPALPEIFIPCVLVHVFEFASSVEEADVIVPKPPREIDVPLTVIEELESLLLAIEPASIVLVTVPVSVVYIPFVTVAAFPFMLPAIMLVNVCVPPHVLDVEVESRREIAFVERDRGYEKVSGDSYVPKSETCDLVIARPARVVS